MVSESTLNGEVKSVNQGKRVKQRKKVKDELQENSDGKAKEPETDDSTKHKIKNKKRKSEKSKECPPSESVNDTTCTSSKKKKKTSISSAIDEVKEGNEEDVETNSETTKPTSKTPSKRQLKREKAEKRESERKEASRLDAIQRALNYVSKWKHARSEWKFEKLRQVWLIENLLDNTAIPDNMFPTVLEYFEGCKGMARKQLLEKAMSIIKKAEEQEEESEESQNDITESAIYKRARQLMQALPTEN